MLSLIVFILLISVSADISAVRPGPITLSASEESITVRWPDETQRLRSSEFSLNSERPLITAIGVGPTPPSAALSAILGSDRKTPGRTGFDEGSDLPGNRPEGTRGFEGTFRPVSAQARAIGGGVEVLFEGLKLGILNGGIAYTFILAAV